MSLSTSEMQRVIHMVWTTQLGLVLEAADPSDLADTLSHDSTVLVTVYIAGDFSGRIEQRCSSLLSLNAAVAAFAASGKDVGTSDIRDTATEMAHMTAGNLKLLLSGAIEVSNFEPEHSDGGDESVIAEAGFTVDGEPLVVSLIRTG